MEDALLPVMRQSELSGFQLIHYHRRGYGGSTTHDGALSFQQEANDALSLLDDLSVERAHVVGYSSGGVIAYQLALSSPKSVQSLSLIEPALRLPGSNDQPMALFMANAIELYRAGDTENAVDAFWSVVGNPDWKQSIQAALPDGLEQVLRNANVFFELEAPGVSRYSFEQQHARSIGRPILYLVSDGGAARSAPLRELFKSWLPQMEESFVDNADHALPLQQPKAIALTIREFLVRYPMK
jgi:3-oxoadipate enol-lactonase